MCEDFFGLRENPFLMTPDPSYLYLTAPHREALAGLMYAVLGRKGFVVLTGEAGTGKTTLLTKVLQSIPSSRANFSLIVNPTLTPAEFLELVLMGLGMHDVPTSKARRLAWLQEYLTQANQQTKISVLIVDEAHKLSPELLEEIRLLTNFETAQGKLLQIVLAGQSELAGLLNREDLRQLKQRVAVRVAVRPLTGSEVEHYIRHRWARAGGPKELPFGAEAIRLIASVSRGIPRVISAICDNALVVAYGSGSALVEKEHVLEAARDLDLSQVVESSDEAPRPVAMDGVSASRSTLGLATPQRTFSVPTLDRYSSPGPKPPWLMRWAERLRLGAVVKNPI